MADLGFGAGSLRLGDLTSSAVAATGGDFGMLESVGVAVALVGLSDIELVWLFKIQGFKTCRMHLFNLKYQRSTCSHAPRST